MSREDRERALQANKRAIIQEARELLDDVEDQLYRARTMRQQRRTARLVRKIYPDNYYVDLDDVLIR
jgi:hypothetical protein